MRHATIRFLLLTLMLPLGTLGVTAAETDAKRTESTIFSYDGQDFVRTATSLSVEGKLGVDTKLDRNSAAYAALSKKRAYSGQVSVFGRDYEAKYAPIVDDDGKLTGALFVGVPK